MNSKLNPEQIEAAAKVIAQCMDYPWEHMPEQGRATMRKHAKTVLAAALPIDFKQATDQGGWQPIATAPKDGARFLAVCGTGRVRLVRWADYGGDRFPIGDVPGDIWPDAPTHWMPLPAAPTLLGVADGDAA